MKKTPLKVVL